MTTIRNGRDLKVMIDSIISESKKRKINLIKEDENKTLLLDDPEQSNISSDDKEAMKKGDVTPDQIIEKLNSIRSGKSFKDSLIKSSIDKYIGELSKAEKTALFAFLKGIAQIVTGEIDATVATEPSDPEPAVAMKKKESQGKKTVVIKPSVIKKPNDEEKSSLVKSTNKEEDTTPPIQAKKK